MVIPKVTNCLKGDPDQFESIPPLLKNSKIYNFWHLVEVLLIIPKGVCNGQIVQFMKQWGSHF